MKSLLEIINEEKPFSRWGLFGGLHYLFWRVYHGYYFWILFNVIWRYRIFKPPTRWTEKRLAKKALKASLGLREMNQQTLGIDNPRIEVIDSSFKRH
ncbi:MAG: hypothetical protein QOH25_3618 [Acidobacteriota bacterium]|jgi:hypothetical protein|nr:hypothetical protein [Acidobacteriota bacterium]